MIGYRHNPEPDDDDDRIERRAGALVADWITDSDRVREAIVECLADDEDNLIALDLSSAFVAWERAPGDVRPDDIVGRFHELMRCMRARIAHQLQEDAEAQAERESRDWPAWRGSIEATRFHAQRNAHRYED